MLKATGIVAAIFLLLGCGEVTKSPSSPPPPELVGVWEEATNQKKSSRAQDDCKDITVGKSFVSTGLLFINDLGNVYDGKEMKALDRPYRLIGQVAADGLITPNDVGRREFLGSFASVGNGTFNPIVTANFGKDPFKGDYIALKIDLQFVGNGQSTTKDWVTKEYYKLTPANEESLISKAQKCLTKAKSTPQFDVF